MTEHQNGEESAISIMHLEISYADFMMTGLGCFILHVAMLASLNIL